MTEEIKNNTKQLSRDDNHTLNETRLEPSTTSSKNLTISTTRQQIQKWLPCFGGFLILFNIWGFPIAYGAFQAFYELSYLKNSSASAITWIGSTQGFLLIAFGLVAGLLFDLGYLRLLLCGGSLLSVFGMMMTSISTKYYQIFLSQGICAGIGFGMLYVPTLAIITESFPKQSERAVAMGVVTSGIAVGGIVYTLTFSALLPRLAFPWTVRILAFISLGTFLLAIPILLIHSHTNKPHSPNRRRKLFDRTALTDPPFLLFTLAQFLLFLGYLVPLFYIPVYAQVALHASSTTALHLLVALQAASFFGRLAAGIAASHLGTMLLWILCGATGAAVCFAWIAMRSVRAFVAFCIIYGFTTGGLVALPASIFPLLSPAPHTLGARMGMAWTSSGISYLIGAPIASAVVDLKRGDFLGLQAWGGGMLAAGCAVLGVLWCVLVRKGRRGLLV